MDQVEKLKKLKDLLESVEIELIDDQDTPNELYLINELIAGGDEEYVSCHGAKRLNNEVHWFAKTPKMCIGLWKDGAILTMDDEGQHAAYNYGVGNAVLLDVREDDYTKVHQAFLKHGIAVTVGKTQEEMMQLLEENEKYQYDGEDPMEIIERYTEEYKGNRKGTKAAKKK